MSESPYLVMTVGITIFAVWSSLWPRAFLKQRLEPIFGFKAYRIFYNIGKVGLVTWACFYLAAKGPETPALWDFRDQFWLKPALYVFNFLGVFFGASLMQHGATFWGIKNPPATMSLHTTGYYKITRHPLYWSVFFLFFAHMLQMGTWLSVLFFALMEGYNLIGVLVFENRALKRQFGADFDAFKARVSTIPFLSLLQGRVTMEWGELPVRWIGGSLAFTLLAVLLHPWIPRSLVTIASGAQ